MKSKGNFFHVRKPKLETNYTQIPNEIFSLKLSTTEKIILAYLFSNSETWSITQYQITKVFSVDKRTVKKALAKFSALGFISEPDFDTTITINLENIISYRCSSTPMEDFNRCQPTPIEDVIENEIEVNNNDDRCSPTPIIGVSQHLYRCSSTPIIGVEQHHTNTNTILNQEKNQEEKKEKEEATKVPSSSLDNQNLGSGSSFFHSPQEVNYQIEQYLQTESKFFFGDNKNIVSNTYTEFYKEYPESKATINGYEEVLYMYLKSTLSTMMNIIDNPTQLNEELNKTNSLVIPPVNIKNLMNSIKTNRNGEREVYNKILSDIKMK